MSAIRNIHPDFLNLLKHKEQGLIDLYMSLRAYMLELYPDSTEILYHTHALSSVYSISEKFGDGFCMIPIYTNHLNLGFHRGTLLPDPKQLLKGTGKLIRHIPITKPQDFNNDAVKTLINAAIELAINESKSLKKPGFKIISKIKR